MQSLHFSNSSGCFTAPPEYETVSKAWSSPHPHTVPSDQAVVNEDPLMQPTGSSSLPSQLSSGPQLAQTGTTTSSSFFLPPTPRPSVDSDKKTGTLATQLLVV